MCREGLETRLDPCISLTFCVRPAAPIERFYILNSSLNSDGRGRISICPGRCRTCFRCLPSTLSHPAPRPLNKRGLNSHGSMVQLWSVARHCETNLHPYLPTADVEWDERTRTHPLTHVQTRVQTQKHCNTQTQAQKHNTHKTNTHPPTHRHTHTETHTRRIG